MELVSMEKNCLGTMSFTLKMGKMKKAEEFVTYPIQKDDKGEYISLQSEHRWAQLYTKTGAIVLSARRAQYANLMWLLICISNKTAEIDKASDAQLKQMLDAVRGTASPMAGGNNVLNIYCDNSNADKV